MGVSPWIYLFAYDKIKIHKETDKTNIETGERDEPTNPIKVLDYLAKEFSDEGESAKEYNHEILETFKSLEAFENLSRENFMKWANERYQSTLTARAERVKKRSE